MPSHLYVIPVIPVISSHPQTPQSSLVIPSHLSDP